MKIRCDGSCGCKAEIVELNDKEMVASEQLDRLLDDGWSLERAVNYLRNVFPYRRVSTKFWAWKLGTRAAQLV